jgi:PAS domain S-box-containing protein
LDEADKVAADQGKILIIEDEKGFRDFLREALTFYGYHIDALDDGREAASKLKVYNPDLILLDLTLPGFDGIELCKIFKSINSSIPIIIITGRANKQDVIAGLEAGADDYIVKPTHLAELLARINSQLRNKKLYDQVEREKNDLAAILEITKTISSQLDPSEIFFTIVKKISEIIEVDRCSIWLVEKGAEFGYIVAAHDNPTIKNFKIPLSKYPEIRQALQTGEVVFCQPPFPQKNKSRPEAKGPNSIMVLPIMFQNDIMGTLFLRAERPTLMFSEREIRICRGIADAVAVAMKNSQLFASIKEESKKREMALIELERARYAQRELELKAKYEELFEHASDGLITLDRDGFIRFANKKAIEITGYPKEGLVGKHIHELFYTESFSQRSSCPWNILEEIKPAGSMDIFILTKDGRKRCLSVTMNRLPDKENTITLSFRDVTEKRALERRLRESEEKYRIMIEKANDGIIIIQEGLIKFANKKFQEMLGYTAGEVKSLDYKKILAPEEYDPNREVFWKELTEKELSRPFSISLMNRYGNRIEVEVSAAPIEFKGRPAYQVFLRDITRRKQLESELKRHAKELWEANQKLKEMDKIKSNFLAATNHELRTPLTVVKGYIKLLLSESTGKINKVQKQLLKESKESLDRLISLVNSMLDLSRIESGAMEMEIQERELIPCLLDVIKRMEHFIKGSGIKLDLKLPKALPPVPFDKDRIEQVMINLIDNAIKFSTKGGRIRIRVLDGQDQILISVEDQGVGIPEEYQAVIFNEFSQLKKRKGGISGTGLGLAISKKIVEAHGGKIWVESIPQKGSKFYFSLPLIKTSSN